MVEAVRPWARITPRVAIEEMHLALGHNVLSAIGAGTSHKLAGVEPPAWAMQPLPELTVVGPRIAEAGMGQTRPAPDQAAPRERSRR